MFLTIKAGVDPADPQQIELYAGDQKVDNAMVERAAWDAGRLVLSVNVWGVKDDDKQQDAGAVHTKSIRK